MMNIRSRVIPGIVLILSIALSSVALPAAVVADDAEETGSEVSVDGITGLSDGVEGGESAQGVSTGDLNNPLGTSTAGKSAGAEGTNTENTTSTDDSDDSQQGRTGGNTSQTGGNESGGTSTSDGDDPAEGSSGGTSAGSKDSPTSGSASTQSKGTQPWFKLMAMLILSEEQGVAPKGSKATADRNFRELVTALQAIGYLREGASDKADTTEALELFKDLAPPPAGTSSGGSQAKGDEDD